MRFVAGRGTDVQVAGRGTDVQVATRGPMGSNRRGTDEVLMTGAPERRAIGKQLRAKEEPAGKETHCRQRHIVAPAAKCADEMEFIVRSQREP